MTKTIQVTEVRPAPLRLWRGLGIAVACWLLFLVATAYTSAASLFDRIASTEVMRAAAGNAWTGRVTWEIAGFIACVVLLHLAFAGLTWLLAYATAYVQPVFRGKFGRIVVGWFAVLAIATLAYNSLWYPRTLIGAWYHDAAKTDVGPLHLGQLIYGMAFAACASMLIGAFLNWLRQVAPRFQRRMLGAIAALLLVAVGSTFWSMHRSGAAAAATVDKPHVIILGIDSLRLEQLRRFGGTGVTPNLDAFLERADLFADTTTPAARTFSSWVAILTGRAPTVTGARFNLAPRASVKATPTIADVLSKAGYHTVYSTDEVRFANIDESFGFDQVVTPRIGASDFIVGTYNELPLSSLVINTRFGKWLFPFSHANRGVATMFEPETYLARLDREVAFDRPTLLVTHLTAAHWPYYTAETPFGVPMAHSHLDRPMYRVGLQTADRMFGELVRRLEQKGALRNAVVVVLSDHGEAMSLPSDSFFDEAFFVDGLKAPLKMDDFGHGQSVLSKSQYQVLLGMRTFGAQQPFGTAGRTFKMPVTVEDISPTLLDVLGIDAEATLSATGHSLLPALMTGVDEVTGEERLRYTETDLRVLPGPAGAVDEAGTARQNSVFFAVDPKTARLHIKEAYRPLALAYKERAVFTKHQLLAAMPAGPYAHQYIFLDFDKRHGRLLMARPGEDEPAARRLWDAMEEHYKGELRAPHAVTSEDWARIENEWRTFIVPAGKAAQQAPAASSNAG